MKIIIIFTVIFSFFSTLSAQDCTTNVKQDKILKKINKYIEREKFYEAMRLIKLQPNHPSFLALKVEIAWKQGRNLDVRRIGSYIISVCPQNFPNVYYFLADVSFENKDYIQARNFFQKAIDLSVEQPYYSAALLQLDKSRVVAEILENPVPFFPKVIEGVSTNYDEYLPIISPDGNYFFFTRRFLKKGFDMLVPSYVEEFSFSEIESGNYSQGSPMKFPFNQENNEGGASITIDNKILYFTKCERAAKGYNNCDIFYVFKTKDGWSQVQSFSKSICPDSTWESQPSVSSDGKTIIFSSDRSGGYGNMDLYEINYVDGQWLEPKNLGPNINTMDYEKSPFLHPDGQTLFFSTNRFPSVGGYDIFFSKKDSLGSWSLPKNIGYPINSIYDEISLFVSTDGKTAFFSSNQLKGVGGWDIYSFPLHEDASPERVLFVSGELVDENGENIDDAQIEFKNINTQEVIIIDASSGDYAAAVTLEENDDVLVTIKKEGFIFTSKYIDSRDSLFSTPSSLNFNIQSIEEGGSFNLDNVYFATNSYEIDKLVSEVLFEFADYLLINKNIIIEINGYTDNVGLAKDNQILSERRASQVYKLLVDYGISESRLSFNGYGEDFPIADNNTFLGRAKNRRTEFKVVSQ